MVTSHIFPGKCKTGSPLDQHVVLCFPHHEVARQVALQLGTPLVAAMTSAITPDQLTTAVTAQTALIIQDGRTAFAEPDSIVQVNGREWRWQQAGAISAEEIDQAVPCRIMFVCTGNTCRSPLAEGICRKLLADSLNCRRRPDQARLSVNTAVWPRAQVTKPRRKRW